MPRHILEKATVMVVDDEPSNLRLLEIIVGGAGCPRVHCFRDPTVAVSRFEELRPDIVLLDLAMPKLDGYQVMAELQRLMNGSEVPILVLTADITSEAKYRALNGGASDFVTKPIDQLEVLLRIKHLLQHRFHQILLEDIVSERTHDLELSQLETVQRLALAAEYRDDETGLHTRRVGQTSALLAQRAGWQASDVKLMLHASPLHDVGKIGIPDAVLLKPGKLTEDEYAIVKTHTDIGSRILSGSHSPILQLAAQIAQFHHERWDGKGYHSVSGHDIPESARIVALADVFDALTHARPYKPSWPWEQSLQEIHSQAGRQFDPILTEHFLELMCDRDSIESS
jgi:putative two-component system response regulator